MSLRTDQHARGSTGQPVSYRPRHQDEEFDQFSPQQRGPARFSNSPLQAGPSTQIDMQPFVSVIRDLKEQFQEQAEYSNSETTALRQSIAMLSNSFVPKMRETIPKALRTDIKRANEKYFVATATKYVLKPNLTKIEHHLETEWGPLIATYNEDQRTMFIEEIKSSFRSARDTMVKKIKGHYNKNTANLTLQKYAVVVFGDRCKLTNDVLKRAALMRRVRGMLRVRVPYFAILIEEMRRIAGLGPGGPAELERIKALDLATYTDQGPQAAADSNDENEGV
ncbi:hypothetical protein BJ741DRAFT_585345 [Chytriomyces cf. hyalinus JEL632]|nr:hypothetical protein BJ741DRAFT_639419 [Chytriomyces cf. hyalinus JEL632]KAI8820331.1 hypothetical protein BJ741DRAFT_639147 [Chytriomyces cf. hyalinus JEL632]KAI8820334.1 hypothetical protein BJ741DRAFT_639098 [Chytriomyces cf. hyalinus JEL632]KAI8824595.1 hypothetical protein BJ741DRAFT_633380 [Chytriomyces cf. hyalinus JEL632]KAI8824730.1 hypothetical protein BJ741DRAFT_632906 [Chytriomyces cf. hyalinus JEL632]